MRKTLASLILAASLPVVALSAYAESPRQLDCPYAGGMGDGHMMPGGYHHEGYGPMHGDGDYRHHHEQGERGMPHERGEGHGMRGERGFGMRGLDLSAVQRDAMRDAMRDYMQRERDRVQTYLDKLPAAEKQAMQKDAEASLAERDKAIEAVLKPEQLKRYQEMRAEREKRHAERLEFEAWKASKAAAGKAE